MAAKHQDINRYYQEIPDNPGLQSPHNGAVFHTNGAYPQARAYADSQPNRQVVETTAYGRELDAQGLHRDDRFIEAHGRRGANRVWDKASTEYASQASGSVEVFTNGKQPRESGTFARREMPALLENERVTHINGIERQELQQLYQQDKRQVLVRIGEADKTRQSDLDPRQFGREAGQVHGQLANARNLEDHKQAGKRLDQMSAQACRHPECLDHIDDPKVRAEMEKRVERERQRQVHSQRDRGIE